MVSQLAILGSLLFVVLSFLVNLIYKPIGCKNIPGPSLHLGTRFLMFIQLHFFQTVPVFTEFWCRRYGDTVGVWINGGYTIASCDADFVQKILGGTHASNFISRTGNDDGLKAIGMYQKGIIWNNDVPKWTLQRRIFQSGLSSNVRKKAFDVALENARQEIKGIKATAQDNNTVPTIDLLNFLRHSTLAITLDVALGIQLDRERSQYLIDCIVDYFKAWEFFLMKPRFIWPLFPLRYFHHKKAVSKLQELIRNLVSTLNSQAAPFLSHLHENELTIEEINQCVLEMVLAGTDTSSVSLYYTFILLTENEKIQNQLLDSQDDSFLESILRESMRIMPVGPVIIRKAIADCDISGTRIQAGTNIVINVARMNRHPKWFQDPLKFNPQRFQINEDLAALSATMGGKGPRSCVGQNLAMVEMKPILRELMTAFKFTREKDAKAFIETETKWDIALQPVIREKLTVLPRKGIVLVGAHSVGKSTLSKLIRSRINAVLIDETARTVMKQLNMNADLIKNDPEKSLNLQASIIKFQCEREEKFKHECAIYDRSALDALVYAKSFCGKQWESLLEMPETNKCIERYKQSDKYLVFIIEPHMECLKDDGTRMMSNNYQEWKAFSEEFKIVMNDYKINYRVINELDLEQRFSIVFQALFGM
ncbi:1022_t:CDS:1 [Funneliformis geosporum]|uniref:4179_t:CDS:1 n=1 Tax=Funneliformis geosporum TaxID=1117311 RepID=A0A9W4SF08_9GLOM|nr:1022_t:CDS:1 [Funneliformis geosporum]CAI2167160.1 4179_t:CDS:1 [Funneliformis geosporum]